MSSRSNPQSSPSATTKTLEEIVKHLPDVGIRWYNDVFARQSTIEGRNAVEYRINESVSEALAAIDNLINQRVIEELESR